MCIDPEVKNQYCFYLNQIQAAPSGPFYKLIFEDESLCSDIISGDGTRHPAIVDGFGKLLHMVIEGLLYSYHIYLDAAAGVPLGQ